VGAASRALAGFERWRCGRLAWMARAVPGWAWAFSLYVGFATATIGRGALASPAHVCACNSVEPDPASYMWALAWWPHALLSGINPLHTGVIWVPIGGNVAGAAMMPAAAIAMWPVTALFGVVVSFNVLAVLAPSLCGLTAYLLCRRLTGSTAASLMGGFLFGFSSYELSQALGHPDLTLVFLLPVMVLLALRRLDRELSRARFVAALALVFVVQALLSTEVLFDAGLVGAGALIVGAWVAPRRLRSGVGVLASEILVAGVAAAVVLLPFLIAALAQKQVPGGGFQSGLDALNLVVPTQIALIGGHLFRNVTAGWESYDYYETGGYIGIPLLLALDMFARANWRTQRRARFLIVMFVATVVLALGSALRVGGHALIPLPWAILDRLPLFRSLVPSRFMVFAALILAVSIAIWLAQASQRRYRRWFLACIGAAALLPSLTGNWWTSRPENPAFFRTAQYQRYLTRGETILTIPFAGAGLSMLWQAETGFYFKMVGGYLSTAEGGSPRDSAAIAALNIHSQRWLNLQLSIPGSADWDARAIRAFLHEHRIRHIVVQPSYQQMWTPVLRQLARSPTRVGGILLYTVTNPR
jgi:hypothetical protein